MGDAADITAAFNAYDTSGIVWVPASSDAHAESLRAAFNSGGGQGVPFGVFRTDLKHLMLHPNTGAPGEGFDYYAGRPHGATAHFTRSGVPAYTPTVLDLAHFQRVSPGITTTASRIVIPQTGYWTVSATTRFQGPNADLSRVFVEVRYAHDDSTIFRFPQHAEDTYTATGEDALGQGQQIYLVAYHQAPGPRDVAVKLNLTQGLSSRWVSV